MNQSDREALLRSTLKTLRGKYPDACAPQTPVSCPLEPGEQLLSEFVYSFLLWESTAAKAAAALKRLETAVVDFNELRVCLPDELSRHLGERYPRAEERSIRLRAALNDIFSRQHSVSLEHLGNGSKREAKDYLESLEGTPRYVASRVLLIRLGLHAAPVDSRIARRLSECGLVEEEESPEAAAVMLERKTKAGELLETYQLLQAWADDGAAVVEVKGGKKKDPPKKKEPPEGKKKG